MKHFLMGSCKFLALSLILFYQWFISPVIHSFCGGGCCFTVSCSRYSYHCFQTQPFGLACYHSLQRVLSCHPFR